MVETIYVELQNGFYYEGDGHLGIDLNDMRTLAPWIPEDVSLWVCPQCGLVNSKSDWECVRCGRFAPWRIEAFLMCAEVFRVLTGDLRKDMSNLYEHWAGGGWCDG